MSKLVDKIKTKQQELAVLDVPMFVKVNEALENANEISKAAAKRFGYAHPDKIKSDKSLTRPINTHNEIGKIAGCGKTTVYEVEYLNKHASKELMVNLISGKISIHGAYTSIVTIKDKIRKDVVETDAPIKLINGECLEEISHLKDGSIDLLVVDLPYGTTACSWDSIIDLPSLWTQLNRVCKESAAMVFTAQQPFTWKLASSNPTAFKYELIWQKPNGTNPFAAKNMPMKRHENILVFYRSKPTYNPQMEQGKPYVWDSKRSKGEAGGMAGATGRIESDGKRYPSSILKFKQERGLHPTQKPVALMEWLIKSFSNEGDVVLDCTMGSGTTGVAAKNLKRKFIGIELSKEYFDIATKRIGGE